MGRFLVIGILLTVIGTVRGHAAVQDTARPQNLGLGVNSAYDELLPVISPDGRTLFFCRSNHPQNVGGVTQDIWYSERQPDGTWGTAINIGPPLNNRLFNYVFALSPDGNTMIVGDRYGRPTKPNEDPSIAVTHRTANGWSEPRSVRIAGYHNQSMFAEFTMSNDGGVLIMSPQRYDSHGGRDLYVSFKRSDSSWSEPMNLGPTVNSISHDVTPFLASDNTTLYFATDGRGGFGGYDIFVTRRLDSTWTSWSEPMNIGATVNTPSDDLYYTVPASGDYAYYVSYRNTFGASDIFRLRIADSVRPRPVALVKGRVLNKKTGEPIEADITYEILSTGVTVGTARSTPVTGQYTIVLPAEETYGFLATAPGFISVADNVDLHGITEYTEVERDLYLVPIEQGGTVALNNIFFDYNKTSLRKESMAELARLARLLKEYPGMTIEIGGHTDDRGSDDYNRRLSAGRAQACVDYVVNLGVPGGRIKAVGYGESRPVASNDTDEGRQKNRRVEVTILTQ